LESKRRYTRERTGKGGTALRRRRRRRRREGKEEPGRRGEDRDKRPEINRKAGL